MDAFPSRLSRYLPPRYDTRSAQIRVLEKNPVQGRFAIPVFVYPGG